jgi:oligopeptide transport system ATP-binding protein
LLSAIPIADPDRNERRVRLILEGDVPSPLSPPPACRFHTRCPFATEICWTEEPALKEHAPGRLAACHHPRNLEATAP